MKSKNQSQSQIQSQIQEGNNKQDHENEHSCDPVLNRALADYFHKMLYSEQGKYALDYIYSRGIYDATIEKFNIGWCPDNWHGSIGWMNWKAPRRIMVPLINAHDDYITFHTRIVTEKIKDSFGNDYIIEQKTGRIIKEIYLNGEKKDNDIVWYHGSFDKSTFLFGLNETKKFIKEKKYVILVEGIFDALILYENGLKNVVATLGTALTAHQICMISRYADLVVFMWDSDDAGKKALIKSQSKSFLDHKSLSLPDGYDPNDFVLKYGIKPILEGINEIFT